MAESTPPNRQPIIEPRLTRLTLFAVDLLTEAVRNAHIEHWQLCPGVFQGRLTQLQRDGLIVNTGCYSRTLLARGELPTDAVMVGAILDASEDGIINGTRFGNRDLVCLPPGAELEYLLPARTHWLGIQIPTTLLPTLGLDQDWFRRPRVVSASAPGCAAVVTRLAQVSGDAGMAPCQCRRNADDAAHVGLDMAADDWRADLAGVLRALFARSSVDLPIGRQASFAERMQLLWRFEAHVRERIAEPLRIPSICDALGVNQRTLELVFQHQTGLAPLHCLRILRLNAVRRALQQGAARERGIAAVAADFGLRHAGRFAIAYRRFFGESPSATSRLSSPM
jgi:AraC family ethanolamine operon transcriptional activator